MDRDRIRRAATGKSGGKGGAAPRRLLIYGLLIALLLAKLLFDAVSGEATVERPAEPLASLDVPAAPRAPRAEIDPARLAGVRDRTAAERVNLEREARVHLLEQASTLLWGDLDKLGLRFVEREELEANPDAYRGEPVWALGTVQWIDQSFVDGLLEVRGELRDERGRPWLFLVVTEPWEIEQGDVVRVSGFFFKNARMLDPQGRFVEGPLVVGEELLPSAFRIDPVTELDEGLRDGLRRVRDSSLEDASRHYTSQAFYELLSFVQHGSEQDVFPDGTPPPEIPPADLLKFSSRYRGEPVRMTGTLLEKRHMLLGPQGENPLGVPLVYELYVHDARAGKNGNILALSLEDPGDFEPGDILEIDGLFFRRWAFENRLNEPRMATLLLAREVTEFVPVKDPVPGFVLKIILAVVFGGAALLVLAQWRERRSAGGERTRRMKRKARMVARELRDGEGARASEADAAPNADEGAPPPPGDDAPRP